MGKTDLRTFGQLLKHYRLTARLTQEDLAERAGLSVRGISDLERDGIKTPRRPTVALLTAALELSAPHQLLLEETLKRRRGPRATHHPHAAHTSPPRGRSAVDNKAEDVAGRSQAPRVTSPAPRHHTSKQDATDGEPARSGKLSRQERFDWTLEYLQAVGPISPREYVNALGVDRKTASTDLRALCDTGRIAARGVTRDRRYARCLDDAAGNAGRKRA